MGIFEDAFGKLATGKKKIFGDICILTATCTQVVLAIGRLNNCGGGPGLISCGVPSSGGKIGTRRRHLIISSDSGAIERISPFADGIADL